MKKAVVLVSGGLDSTTCVAMAKAAGFEPVCLAVAYGQLHRPRAPRQLPAAEEGLRGGRSPGPTHYTERS